MNPTNTILLRPTDVLFFRDGRPMEGSLSGHGAAWPLPNVTNTALHAALHQSGLNGHAHDHRHHTGHEGNDNRRFGSLVTAGPFPVQLADNRGTPLPEPRWFFPKPLDLLEETLEPTLMPVAGEWSSRSNLPAPLKHAVGNVLPPNKDSKAKAWLSTNAYDSYIALKNQPTNDGDACDDSAFSDQEATVGIAIDADTGAAGQGDAVGRIYSARYLRLRDGWRLGVFAKTDEKDGKSERRDLIPELINEQGQLLVGGQQRLCTATLRKTVPVDLPRGRQDGFNQHGNSWLVKWVLLSPAIWPEISDRSTDNRPMMPHSGGWLPNWVREADGQVMLRSGKRKERSYNGKHTRGYDSDASAIAASLVAAIVPKPIPVTGWALQNEADRREGGAKSSLWAVPAGAVYYFTAETRDSAKALAAALNWHGSETDQPNTIRNRRSTLMGEKGFGLGVCGTWEFHGGGKAS